MTGLFSTGKFSKMPRETNRRRFAFVFQGEITDALLAFLHVSVMESCQDADGVCYCYLSLARRMRVSRLLGCIDNWNKTHDKINVRGNVEVFPGRYAPDSPIVNRIREERCKTLNRADSTYRAWSR